MSPIVDRRAFLKTSAAIAGCIALGESNFLNAAPEQSQPAGLQAASLPKGNAPKALPLPHFPSRFHAFVWRNWTLATPERMASVTGATPGEVVRTGRAMGLSGPPPVTKSQQRRSNITVIRRNWHLLPYEQLLTLLDWTPEQMAFALREDDFLYVKLGNLKPQCEPLRYSPPGDDILAQEKSLAQIIQREFPGGVGSPADPHFAFVARLSSKPSGIVEKTKAEAKDSMDAALRSPRFCYSYFALYGDPLLEPELDPYPDGCLARMAAAGVNGVWLQAVLNKLAPFPWDAQQSEHYQKRLENLNALVKRARSHGIGVYLYLNEPRSLPLAFYQAHPELQGAREGDYAALCTSAPDVQKYISGAIESICRATPDLAGFFTISGSENLSNCWSHGGGASCPRCGKRAPAEVIAELHTLICQGIRQSGAKTRLIAWDWGWDDAWAPDIITRLPQETSVMSVSEWSIPIKRGGVETSIGEYSLSTIGPGPRASRHWELARKRGLKTIAKVQLGNSWELSAVPYNPVLENVARHALNLRRAKVDGMMLGWTLGGYPSPNLEVAAEAARVPESGPFPEPAGLLETVAKRRFGSDMAPAVVKAWTEFSAAFREFPFHGGVVYNAPLQCGPANLLWSEPTGYPATMVGIPYDDLNTWRAVYPEDVFIGQLEKIANGFDQAIDGLQARFETDKSRLKKAEQEAVESELNIARAASIHFRSAALQARFVQARNALAKAAGGAEARPLIDTLGKALKEELTLARRLQAIQDHDSRIGFEATNQYYYVGVDFGEKVLNCLDLLHRWLPKQRARFNL